MFSNTQDSFVFTGTAKQFQDSKIYLNGRALDQITVNNLAKHQLLEDAGDGPKPMRGRTPRLYRAVSRPGMLFTVAPVTAESTDAAATASEPQEIVSESLDSTVSTEDTNVSAATNTVDSPF